MVALGHILQYMKAQFCLLKMAVAPVAVPLGWCKVLFVKCIQHRDWCIGKYSLQVRLCYHLPHHHPQSVVVVFSQIFLWCYCLVTQSCPAVCGQTPWTAAHQALLSSRVCSNSYPLSQSCHPTISSSVIPFSSHIQSFPASGSFPISQPLPIRWPKYCSFRFSNSPSDEYSGLIAFRMNWLDLLAVQETLKSLLQHRSPKASILRLSAFFRVQLSHPYMTMRKPQLLQSFFKYSHLISYKSVQTGCVPSVFICVWVLTVLLLMAEEGKCVFEGVGNIVRNSP